MEKEELNLSVDKLFNCLTEWSDVTTSVNDLNKKEIICKIKDNYEYEFNPAIGNGLTLNFKENKDKYYIITAKKKNLKQIYDSEQKTITNIGECEILLSPTDRMVLIISFSTELDAAIDLIEKKTKKNILKK